jgi:hypothetical protein
MGRVYTAVAKGIAVTAAQDIFEITAPADAAVVIHGWTIAQSTETGDAAEEMLILTCNRGTSGTTSGSGGGSVTPAAVQAGDPAFGGTVERNNTTIMSGGTITELEATVWNVRVPYQQVYTPETRPVISPSLRWTLESESTPADSVTITATVTFEEIGG